MDYLHKKDQDALFEGNEGLCGSPLTNKCGDDGIQGLPAPTSERPHFKRIGEQRKPDIPSFLWLLIISIKQWAPN